MTRVSVRTYRPGDDGEFLALHNRAFATRRSARHWTWRYIDNPTQRSQLAGAFTADGRCVAAHCGVTLRFWIDGRETLAMLHGDAAVDPELREGLRGGKLSTEVTRFFFDTYCRGAIELVWGFPSPGLRRLVTRFLRFQVLDDVAFLIHEPVPAAAPADGRVRVAVVDRLDADVDRLWRACRTEFRAAVSRDLAYLDWRYRQHPAVAYRLLEARDRDTGDLRGIAVTREGGWDRNVYSLCDWLVPSSDRGAERALLDRAIDDARQLGKRCVVCWLPASALMFHRLQIDHGFFVHGTPYQQVARSWIQGVDRAWLHEHWFRTLGDMDFF